jgi:hypothetical protein
VKKKRTPLQDELAALLRGSIALRFAVAYHISDIDFEPVFFQTIVHRQTISATED